MPACAGLGRPASRTAPEDHRGEWTRFASKQIGGSDQQAGRRSDLPHPLVAAAHVEMTEVLDYRSRGLAPDETQIP